MSENYIDRPGFRPPTFLPWVGNPNKERPNFTGTGHLTRGANFVEAVTGEVWPDVNFAELEILSGVDTAAYSKAAEQTPGMRLIVIDHSDPGEVDKYAEMLSKKDLQGNHASRTGVPPRFRSPDQIKVMGLEHIEGYCHVVWGVSTDVPLEEADAVRKAFLDKQTDLRQQPKLTESTALAS